MHPFAKRHSDKVLEKGELLGIDKSCKYYSSCHHNEIRLEKRNLLKVD